MKTGTVKWFSNAKGFGFIIGDEETGDIFIHYREIEMQGRKTLEPNQRVQYESEETEQGLRATRVIPIPTE